MATTVSNISIGGVEVSIGGDVARLSLPSLADMSGNANHLVDINLAEAAGPATRYAEDGSSNNNHGTLAPGNDSEWSSDVPGVLASAGQTYMWLGDGAAAIVTVADSTDHEFAAGDFTLSAFIKPTSLAAINDICAKFNTTGNQREYRFYVTTGGKLGLETSVDGTAVKTTLTSSAVIVAGTGYHVAVTKSGTGATFYVDGVAVADDGTALDATMSTGTAAFTIGGQTGANFFTGTIGAARAYSDDLLAAEVLTLATDSTPGNWRATNLVGSYLGPQETSVTPSGNVPADGDGINRINDGSSNDRDVVQTTVGNRLTLASTGINSRRALLANGLTQYMEAVDGGFLSDASGMVTMVVKPATIGSDMVLLSSADEASDTRYVIVRINANGKLAVLQNDAGTEDQIEGTTVLVAGTTYVVQVASSGTAYELYVNDTTESLTTVGGSNTGDWFGDVTGLDNVLLGAVKQLAGTSDYYDGHFGVVALHPYKSVALQKKAIRVAAARRYGFTI